MKLVLRRLTARGRVADHVKRQDGVQAVRQSDGVVGPDKGYPTGTGGGTVSARVGAVETISDGPWLRLPSTRRRA